MAPVRLGVGRLFDMNRLIDRLRKLETELHQPDTRRNHTRLAALLHPKFEEFGRSGRKYSREDVLADVDSLSDHPPITAMNFQVARLGERVARLTYTSASGPGAEAIRRPTLRASLWVLSEDGWQLRFHQGTPADE